MMRVLSPASLLDVDHNEARLILNLWEKRGVTRRRLLSFLPVLCPVSDRFGTVSAPFLPF